VEGIFTFLLFILFLMAALIYHADERIFLFWLSIY